MSFSDYGKESRQLRQKKRAELFRIKTLKGFDTRFTSYPSKRFDMLARARYFVDECISWEEEHDLLLNESETRIDIMQNPRRRARPRPRPQLMVMDEEHEVFDQPDSLRSRICWHDRESKAELLDEAMWMESRFFHHRLLWALRTQFIPIPHIYPKHKPRFKLNSRDTEKFRTFMMAQSDPNSYMALPNFLYTFYIKKNGCLLYRDLTGRNVGKLNNPIVLGYYFQEYFCDRNTFLLFEVISQMLMKARLIDMELNCGGKVKKHIKPSSNILEQARYQFDVRYPQKPKATLHYGTWRFEKVSNERPIVFILYVGNFDRKINMFYYKIGNFYKCLLKELSVKYNVIFDLILSVDVYAKVPNMPGANILYHGKDSARMDEEVSDSDQFSSHRSSDSDGSIDEDASFFHRNEDPLLGRSSWIYEREHLLRESAEMSPEEEESEMVDENDSDYLP